MAFFPKIVNPILVMTSDRPGLEDRLQDTLPVFLNTTKVIKTKERLEIWKSVTDPRRLGKHDNSMQCGSLEWLLEQKAGNNGKTDEIQITSGVYLIVTYQCQFPSFDQYIKVM